MCEVYVARDLRRVEWGDAAPRVALKRLLPELADKRQAQAALAQEFFILRRLTHTGIVRVYDLHQEPWGLCYSMEMLEGANMAALPQGMGREARKVAACLFEVLTFLHGRGITHGDIKPSNVFLAPDGRVALIDFTTARVTLRPGQTSVSLALGPRARQHFGACSPLHASPERLESGEPSTADDVFAACCTVHEMLCGTHPFQRLPSLEAAALRLRPSRPAGITVIQWLGLRQGLAFNPAHRPDAARLAALFQGRAILPLPLSRLRWAALRSP